MFSFTQLLITHTLFLLAAWAAPVPQPGFFGDIFDAISGDDDAAVVTALAAVDLTNGFARAAELSRAVYCSTDSLTTLTCGPACDALGQDITFLTSGGDGGLIPLFFVAHDASTNSIIVAHQGTDTDNLLSILNDLTFFLQDIDTDVISAATDDEIKVHSGFQATFKRTADEIMTAVQDGLASTGSTNLVLTGHSLGAAIATLDALMFKSVLDPSVTITTTLFGSPRVGNQEFADFADQQLGINLTRVTNQADPVPLLPPRFLQFIHPSGEVHINAVGADGNVVDVVACAGQENDNCSNKENILEPNVDNHLGPYFDNISFGGPQCA